MFDIKKEIMAAEKSVTILGTLPLRLASPAVGECIVRALQEHEDLSVTVLCESDNDLFQRSLTLDTTYAETRMSFASLRVQRDLINELRSGWGRELAYSQGDDEAQSGRLRIGHVHAPISQYLVRIDDVRLFFAPVTERSPTEEDYVLLEDGRQRELLAAYLDHHLDANRGASCVSAPEDETLQLYDQDRVPRGIYPRSAFYDTDYHQFVVWDFIFDRRGNLLIHLRAANAKDNRGMWDKSVGGHVDWSMELSSPKTAVRELIEELFEDELNKERMAHFVESARNTLYLGDWLPKKRGYRALEEVSRLKTEWAYFSLPEELQVNTPRHLPDGSIRRLRMIAAAFIFVANDSLSPENLPELENSTFRLVKLSDLKNEMERGNWVDEKGDEHPFLPSPDLETIMTGKLRDVLEEASEYIRYVLDPDSH